MIIIITLNTNIVNLFDAVPKLVQRRDSDKTTPDRAWTFQRGLLFGGLKGVY